MRYQGGKSRISNKLSMIIMNEVLKCQRISNNSDGNIENNYFVSLFCGSCVIESKLALHFKNLICNDNHKYLIDLWKGLQEGYELPEYISKEQYQYIKQNKDDDSILSGFVGFGCSFGGKWFGGFAKDKTGTNYALVSKKKYP